MSFKVKLLGSVLCLVLLAAAGAAGWIWQRNGAYGFNSLWRRGGSYWISVQADDARLSPSMRLALSNRPPIARSGTLVWQEPEKGFEVGELPVLVDGKEVDRILLSRIDPALYRFVARNSPSGDKGIDEWEKALPSAVLIVNGSYYGLEGTPDTPIVSEGRAMGPTVYDAKAGAFVAGDGFADIKDLSDQDWQSALAGAENAMVSYPLLIGKDGNTHVQARTRWLANRTFVGKDGQGRVIIGTTREAFFPLADLAEFLKASPLNLKIALNFDGGPIACQSVRLNGFQRKFYARWEAQVYGGEVKLIRWPLSNATWAMPMVLTVEHR
jgi:hypothetical protein